MSKIEVNAVEPQCGTNLTLGANNDFIKLGTGAGFSGGIGTVRWETTVQAGDFGATAGRGYFVNSSAAARTVTLPGSPTTGDIVAVSDYAQSAGTNSITLARNGSNIQGDASDLVITRNGVALTLIFVDATKGWVVTDSGSELDKEAEPEFISASGGTETTSGNFKIHTFTGPGTFTVSSVGNPTGSTTVSYMVVAGGGGGGGRDAGGGGGAGGFRESKAATDSYTASPLNATSGPTYNLPVSVQGYPIAVGGGGTAGVGNPSPSRNIGTAGAVSTFSTITSAGGGFGASFGGGPYGCQTSATRSGGSGGGGGGRGTSNSGAPDGGAIGGVGNTPPVSPAQGSSGGNAKNVCTPTADSGGGGGGATAAGTNGTAPVGVAGPGGAGATTSISGTPTAYSGGGGGGSAQPAVAPGGTGGGGAGANNSTNAVAGTTNRGGGGGGGSEGCSPAPSQQGATGGSGIVIIRYKFQ